MTDQDLIAALRAAAEGWSHDHQPCPRCDPRHVSQLFAETADRLAAALKLTYHYPPGEHKSWPHGLRWESEAKTYGAAIDECRRACREIMGGNLAFVDDDVARALLNLKAERDRLRTALEAAPGLTITTIDRPEWADYQVWYEGPRREALK